MMFSGGAALARSCGARVAHLPFRDLVQEALYLSANAFGHHERSKTNNIYVVAEVVEEVVDLSAPGPSQDSLRGKAKDGGWGMGRGLSQVPGGDGLQLRSISKPDFINH